MARSETTTVNNGYPSRHQHRLTGTHYVLTWVALLVLSVVTFFASRSLYPPWEVPVALAIATTKAALVIMVFMHMIEQRFVNRFVFAVALLFVVILVFLTLLDVNTRPAIEMIQPVTGAPDG